MAVFRWENFAHPPPHGWCALPSMRAAQGLNGKVGFREFPAYYETPVQGTTFMKLRLTAP
ncbi:MAG: hypothetical protein O7A69_03260 [SAR324 cluster bacterium]|nr:hypothetical protein [SAR324 cluster bacterium]